GPQTTELDRVLISLQVDSHPAELVICHASPPTLRVRSLYVPKLGVPLDTSVSLHLVPRGGGNTQQHTMHVKLKPGQRFTGELTLQPFDAQTAGTTWDCEWHGPDGYVGRSLPIHVLAVSSRKLVEPWQKRLEQVSLARIGKQSSSAPPVGNEETNDALAVCQRRIDLLTSETETAVMDRWVLGPATLQRDLESEVSAIERGDNPYRDPWGDHWLPIPIPDGHVPCRVFRPARIDNESLAAGADPSVAVRLPVVICLHGAGGNEHMFFETLGAGRIKQLAEQHRFLAVAPATFSLVLQPQRWKAFLDGLERFYPVDRGRIYVIGHSMGAFAAAQLAALHPSDIRGMALVAGGPRIPPLAKQFPPTRVYLPRLDKIVPAGPIRLVVERCQKRGLPMEMVEVDHYGHVLAVGRVIDEAVTWLLDL
ncbi:MAG TPA: alpha/beta fold hydrolase, partial [Pirellulaceae bacterium]